MVGFEWANLCSLGDLLAGLKIDPGLLHFYQMGLGVGLVILSTVILFPGRVVPESNKNSELFEKAASLQESTAKDQKDEATDIETRNANTNTFERSPAVGSTPVEQHAGQRPRGRDRSSQDSDGGGWTPHRRLNYIVYIILITGAFVVLDREYGGILTVWLRVHFPREAKTLGFKVHHGVV